MDQFSNFCSVGTRPSSFSSGHFIAKSNISTKKMLGMILKLIGVKIMQRNMYEAFLKIKKIQEENLKYDSYFWKNKAQTLQKDKDELYIWKNSTEILQQENGELKKILQAKTLELRKIIEDIKDSSISENNNYKAKIEFAINSISDIIRKSLENKDSNQTQNMIRLESNINALEYLKCQESKKNKILIEEVEKLKKINDEKDEKINELNLNYVEALAEVERIRTDYNYLYWNHSKCADNFTLLFNDLFQGITNDFATNNFNYPGQALTPIGFPNIGQTCYLNSILQVLFYSPEFLKLTYLSSNNLLSSISKFASNIQNTNSLSKYYHSLYQELMRNFPQVESHHEQDAKEILCMILSEMNEIDQKRLFAIVSNKIYECSQGHHYPSTDQSFFIILPLISNIESTLKELYDNKKYDELYCQDCESMRKQTLHVSSIEFPLYLIFYIPKSKENARRANLNFYNSLEISQGIYSLYAIICYRQHYNYGHYLAYICIQGVWYECDDSQVKRQLPDHKSAYLLFYQKNK